MIQRLFVYGTLSPDGPNRHVLAQIGGDLVRASVRGRLHEAGWGAEIGYPAIVLDECADPVEGYLFVSANLAEHWHELDDFEGEEYERVVTLAQLQDRTTVDAFIYVLRK